MDEVFKSIKGYEGLYSISNLGRVRSDRYNRIISSRLKKNGYLEASLNRNNIKIYYKIHRLVAEAFLPNPNNYSVVDHIDGNRSNNNINNLQWTTQKNTIYLDLLVRELS